MVISDLVTFSILSQFHVSIFVHNQLLQLKLFFESENIINISCTYKPGNSPWNTNILPSRLHRKIFQVTFICPFLFYRHSKLTFLIIFTFHSFYIDIQNTNPIFLYSWFQLRYYLQCKKFLNTLSGMWHHLSLNYYFTIIKKNAFNSKVLGYWLKSLPKIGKIDHCCRPCVLITDFIGRI